MGKFRPRLSKNGSNTPVYSIELEYSWNNRVYRKAMNVYCKDSDWNANGNLGRGELRPSYGVEYKRTNQLLLSRLERTDAMLAEYHRTHSNPITGEIIADILNEKPVTRKDKGADFVDFVVERLEAEHARNRIGMSRYQNGLSCMGLFREFLLSMHLGTYRPDGIYVGEISTLLLEKYIQWRREVKDNTDATINHALTPIIKACGYACDLGILDPKINAQIQHIRIVVKKSLVDTEDSDCRSLTDSQFHGLIEYYNTCSIPRRKEFLEMFLFSYHACGLRLVDVMTLQWGHINFEKKELRKVLVKTNKRHEIPLSDSAIKILERWREKRGMCRYVFDLVREDLDLNDEEALYRARNNATKCINQSLLVVGEQLAFPFPLTMHVARHTFAVHALNNGMSMSVVSRLLGHANTEVTEQVYAHYLPDTLMSEVEKLKDKLDAFSL